MKKFVNPYTFLPLPTSVRKNAPNGHGGFDGSRVYSGKITVEWELKSPLLLPVEAEREGWLTEDSSSLRRKWLLSVPGSSVKGALRSLHEAAFFGCLSVIDQDYIPSYREGVSAAKRIKTGDGWTIGIVSKVDVEGKPLAIKRTQGDTVWFKANELLKARGYNGAKPRTGDIIKIDKVIRPRGRGRIKAFKGEFVRRGDEEARKNEAGCYVVVITDTAAREEKNSWWWGCKQLSSAKAAKISDEAWERFLAKVEGSEDTRLSKAPKGSRGKELKNNNGPDDVVRRGGKALGKRLLQTGKFRVGDALWVRVVGSTVIDMSYSAIWRRTALKQGSDEVLKLGGLLKEDGFPNSLAPCDPNSDDGMCMSCSIFGAIGNEGEKLEKGRGYAGHVRIGSLELTGRSLDTGVVVKDEERFMALAAPHPSNAQFYLQNPETIPNKRGRDRNNLAYWDRPKSEGGKPKLAGRKFYWSHDPLREHGRDRKHPHYRAPAEETEKNKEDNGREQLVRPRKFVLAENTGQPVRLVGEVAFDQISKEELASLWCLFDHDVLLRAMGVATGDTVVRLGGGKPLGFGAVKPKIIDFSVSTTRDRYLNPDLDSRDTVAESTVIGLTENEQRDWLGKLKNRVTPEGSNITLKENLELLSRVMRLDGLGDEAQYVAYPPNASWSEYGTAKFHHSYEFFTKTNGSDRSGKQRQWKPLPKLAPGGESQVIEWK